jgi:hypothetical protein
MPNSPWYKWWTALVRSKKAVHTSINVVSIVRCLAHKIDTSLATDGYIFGVDEDFVRSLLRSMGWLHDGRR